MQIDDVSCLNCSLWHAKMINKFSNCASVVIYTSLLLFFLPINYRSELNNTSLGKQHKNSRLSPQSFMLFTPDTLSIQAINSDNEAVSIDALRLTSHNNCINFPSDSIPDEELLIHKRNRSCCNEEYTKGRYCAALY